MANRRIGGWKQGQVIGFASPMTITVRLTHSGSEVFVPYEDTPAECRVPGRKVWWRYCPTFYAGEIEERT